MILRDYQQSIFNQVIASNRNDLIQLDTGAGKTPIIAKLAEHYGDAIIVCHRNILIKQASEKLAMCGLTHRVIASRATKKICANNNIAKVGKHCLNPRSRIELVSIDTINNQVKSGTLTINKNAKVLLIDEAHHLAEENKWSALAEVLNIRCVGFTATPCRGDGQPMLTSSGGFFDTIIQAEGYAKNGTERLISEGFLAEYECFYYKTEQGDNTDKLGLGKKCPEVLNKFAKNRQTIIIEPRIENAKETVEKLKELDYNSAVIHSLLPQSEIERVLQAFDAKHIQCLIAVDMINEGFDVPDADVLILNRKVASFGLYRQLCGRVLRPREGKQATIIDVNGYAVAKHGLPSEPVDWHKRQGSGARLDLTSCGECGFVYKRKESACPSCGAANDLANAESWLCMALEMRVYASHEVQAIRNRIANEKALELRREAERIEREAAAKTYYDYTPTFQSGILGKRCEHFFNTAVKELKEKLCPADYNAFFKKNISQMGNIDFYAGVVNGRFDKHPASQIKRLYEARK